ncbi:hypothetical protein BT63DRAFT_228182 [Microthyrium microscopicum]|uniref:Ankyrin repeat protein n=1 Tax=Microthyrium microscopicum TaxID=703497 RepID=A0A6A6UE06_9PEZI|nr:hypothetical protein BT63DRAFT_228182 [Microthyrium microscopicum]
MLDSSIHTESIASFRARRKRNLVSKNRKYCVSAFDQDQEYLPLSLDEYCNPGLDQCTLNRRNNDQVLVRYQGGVKNQDLNQIRLITIPQLWIWKIGEIYMTASSEDLQNLVWTEGGTSSESMCFDYIYGLPHRSRSGSDGSATTDSPELLAGLVMSRFLDLFHRPTMGGLSEPILNVFETSISNVSERVNRYLRELDSISLETEGNFLHEIADVRDELSMIQSVVLQQEEIWREIMYKSLPHFWPNGQDGQFQKPLDTKLSVPEIMTLLEKPQMQFPKIKRRMAKLDKDAERVERSILVKLDLKQKHASLRESRTASAMSAAVFGLTVITIIFTPLSFLAALFSLSVDIFPHNESPPGSDDGTPKYTVKYIGKWMVTAEFVSLIVTGMAVWAALEFIMRVRVTRFVTKYFRSTQLYKRLQPSGLKCTTDSTTKEPERLWNDSDCPDDSTSARSSRSTRPPTIDIAQRSTATAIAQEDHQFDITERPRKWKFWRRDKKSGPESTKEVVVTIV